VARLMIFRKPKDFIRHGALYELARMSKVFSDRKIHNRRLPAHLRNVPVTNGQIQIELGLLPGLLAK